MNPHQYAARLEQEVALLETEAARQMAAEELGKTHATLMLHLI
jgi:hypothetical protein